LRDEIVLLLTMLMLTVAFRWANPTGRQFSRPRRTAWSLSRWSLGNSLWWLVQWCWCVSCLLSAGIWVRLLKDIITCQLN